MLYKLTIWQYKINVTFSVLFLLSCLLWLIFDNSRLEPFTVLFGGIAALSSLIWPKPNYSNKRLKGRDSFNYSSNNGVFTIGEDDLNFGTQWTKASDSSIHLYNDHSSIRQIALARNVYNFSEIRNPNVFDFTSRTITINENEIVVLVNQSGHYALVKIIDIKDNSRNDDRDEITIEWVINPDKQIDFS